MERLTERLNRNCVQFKVKDYGEIADRLSAYEETGLIPEEIIEHEEMFKAYRAVCGGKSPEEIQSLQAELERVKAELSVTVEALKQVQHDIDGAECRDDLDSIKGYIDEEIIGKLGRG